MTEEKIIEKIRKLLALADRTDNEEEAAAFFEKAQHLMVAHAIEEQALKAMGDAKAEKIVVRVVDIPERDEIKKAKHILLNSLAKANRCRIVILGGRGQVSLIGYESDTLFVELLYSSVLMQYAIERTRAWKSPQGQKQAKMYGQSRHIWLQGFSASYALQIGKRLDDSIKSVDSGTALVLYDRSQDVEAAMAGLYPRTKTTSMKLRNSVGSKAGEDAADRADLTGGRNTLKDRASRSITR